jgi:hypothetical protein
MARLSADTIDKALWLTLAQSWARLAEHVAQIETKLALEEVESDGPAC